MIALTSSMVARSAFMLSVLLDSYPNGAITGIISLSIALFMSEIFTLFIFPTRPNLGSPKVHSKTLCVIPIAFAP